MQKLDIGFLCLLLLNWLFYYKFFFVFQLTYSYKPVKKLRINTTFHVQMFFIKEILK